MITHWTVIGYYPETHEVYVEHVTGEDLTPETAVDMAHEILPEREDAATIAVFRGHLEDEWGDKGMPTIHEHDDDGCAGCVHPECNARHPYQAPVVSHFRDDPLFRGVCVRCQEEGVI